jgi:hypothetical protein
MHIDLESIVDRSLAPIQQKLQQQQQQQQSTTARGKIRKWGTPQMTFDSARTMSVGQHDRSRRFSLWSPSFSRVRCIQTYLKLKYVCYVRPFLEPAMKTTGAKQTHDKATNNGFDTAVVCTAPGIEALVFD